MHAISYVGEGCVKNPQNDGNVIYGIPYFMIKGKIYLNVVNFIPLLKIFISLPGKNFNIAKRLYPNQSNRIIAEKNDSDLSIVRLPLQTYFPQRMIKERHWKKLMNLRCVRDHP